MGHQYDEYRDDDCGYWRIIIAGSDRILTHSIGDNPNELSIFYNRCLRSEGQVIFIRDLREGFLERVQIWTIRGIYDFEIVISENIDYGCYDDQDDKYWRVIDKKHLKLTERH